jgi:hypothetical protein
LTAAVDAALGGGGVVVVVVLKTTVELLVDDFAAFELPPLEHPASAHTAMAEMPNLTGTETRIRALPRRPT